MDNAGYYFYLQLEKYLKENDLESSKCVSFLILVNYE